MKVTARNLRIREDTAKYLRNLDPNSAYYDPKSRSMRDNPNPEVLAEASEFAGDNFARITGEAVHLADTQLFAWDAVERGVKEIHPQANPSQAEFLKKDFKNKATSLKIQRKQAVLDKYGGQEYLDGTGGLASAIDNKKPADTRTRFGVSTKVETYGSDGHLVRPGGHVKQQPIESKYEEDIHINGHTTVWGSFFHKGGFQWGYKDDHSLMKNSYCTGETGRIANDEANEMRYGTGKAGTAALAQARGMLKAAGHAGGSAPPVRSSKLYGEADPSASVDQDKLNAALARAAKKEGDDKKRKYNSMNAAVDVTTEDMEAYRLLKDRKSDPMASISSEKVLDY
jgi:pre-mRNA-processing factor SLU7